MNSTTAYAPRAARYALLAACLALGAGATVQAGEACSTTATTAAAPAGAVTVRYGDLDLNTSAGAHTLYTRINHAAHQVCDAGNIRDLDAQAASQACERAAVAQAVHAVHSPQLAALVAVKMPQG